jgi:2-iminobutanoate/2-iminopropanoate deaminase
VAHTKEIVIAPKAPAALGPYSAGVKVGSIVYTAGQLGIDPATGNLVTGGIEAQTRQVFHNLQAILEAAGTSLDKVVKTTVFMQDMGEFAKMNGVYAQFFTGDYPARSTIQVATLPKGGLVEIEAIALAAE